MLSRFKLRENNTTVGRELLAGATTFFAMVYIIAVNPSILAISGMPWGAVFLATILTTVVGTLMMGLVYSISTGIGFGFITYTLVRVFRGKAKEVHPIIWGIDLLFILNFTLLALI